MATELHGGRREGAGRKPSGKQTEVIRVNIHRWHTLKRIEKLSDKDFEEVKKFLAELEERVKG